MNLRRPARLPALVLVASASFASLPAHALTLRFGEDGAAQGSACKALADSRVLVPAANAQCRAAIDGILGHAPAFRVVDGQAQRIMIASDAVLLASGTAALEAMLCKRPMVVGHRIAPLTYRIVRLFGLLKSAHVSLPNVLAGETLIPELLQYDCTPDQLHAALLRWFRDVDAVAALQPRFLALHETLRRDASRQAAAAVAGLLQR